MKNLIIVESPSKAKTIQKYLGDGYTVMASSGHVCDLPQKSLGIDIENNFAPMYEVNADKKEVIRKLSQAVKKSGEVYLATDPDREGEAISWHLSNELKLGEDANRIEFHEISKKAVNEAIANPRKINMDLVDAQQARRVLDRLVGYKISPILSKKIKKGSSAGRVQSPALKMIVEREREINNFKPEEYWNIYVFLTSKNAKPFRAQFEDFNGEKFKVTSERIAERAVLDLDKAKYVVDSVKKSVSKSKPNPPFTTSTMQQDASSKLGLSSPETMKIAQQLYEGVDIKGEGPTALVTYIRTDSVRVSSDMQYKALEYIKNRFGEEYVPAKPNFYKTKQDAQDAHEAIRPINLDVTPESIKDKVNRNQYRLYKLIYERFLASQMKDATYDTLNVHINAFKPTNDKPFGFRVKGKTPKFLGYTVIYQNVDLDKKEDEEDEDKVSLPNLAEEDILNYVDYKSEQKFTKPPQRYSDATLVKALEENGIGRPSTYATIISVLAKRDYTEKEGKYIKPTNLGEAIYDYMAIYFKDVVNYKFTAAMETKLDQVASGELVWQEILNKYYPSLLKELQHANVAGGKRVKLEEEVSDVKCDKCGALMVVREGKYGKFLACPNYPNCKNIKPIVEKVGTCPKCGKDVVKKRSKSGKFFYGCSGYPACDFVSWDLPAPVLCEKCGSTMKMVVKKDSVDYVCTNKDCRHKIVNKKQTNEENEE